VALWRFQIVFVEFGIELDWIVRVVSRTFEPAAVAERKIFAWQRPNETEISHGKVSWQTH
jgi:hypothetical protein